MARDFEREYDDYVDEYHGGTDPTPDDAWQDEQERRAWHHEMAEPREPHDDGDDDIPPPEESPLTRPLTEEEYIRLGSVFPTTDPIQYLKDFGIDVVEILRRRGWTVTPPDPDAGPLVTRNAPETSRQAAVRAAVTGGTVEAYILENCLQWGGWTTDEIEAASGRSHGSVSGAMNRLKRKGLVRETDETRPTRGGSPAYVYVLTDIAPEYR